MDLIIGGLYQGKTDFINETYKLNLKESVYFSKYINNEYIVLLNCHMFEGDILDYIESLESSKKIICSTAVVGNAIVPINRTEREFRDNVGLINKSLLTNSVNTFRVWNGLFEKIK